MPNIEHELRHAMIEETSTLGVPPGIAQRAVRGARRGRRSRTAAAVVAAAAAFAVAVPVHLSVTEGIEAASPTGPVDLDGVGVGRLPAGLGVPEQRKVTDGGLPGTSATWGSGDDLVRVTVYRDPARQGGGAERVLGGIEGVPETLPGAVAATVRGRDGFTRAAGDDLVWEERPGLVLRVTVGAGRRGDLRSVAEGLTAEDPIRGAFEGLRVTHVPPGLHPYGPVSVNGRTSWTEMRWIGTGGSVRLLAVRGVDASDAERLLGWARTRQGLSSGEREDVRDRPGYRAAGRDAFARARLWVERPGLGYVLAVNEGLASRLDGIVEGLRPVPPPPSGGDTIDGVTATRLPAGLRRLPGTTARLGDGWSATAARWSDGTRDVEVTVVRGGVLHSAQWIGGFLRGEKREGATGGPLMGVRTTDRKDGRRGVFWETSEVAVHVKADPALAGELDGIVEGIRVPPASYRP